MTKGTTRRVTAFVAALVLPLAGCGTLPFGSDPYAEAHATVTGVREAVHEAGSVTVDFRVRFKPEHSRDGVHWQGTTRLRYGDQPGSETEFTSFSVREPGGAMRIVDLHEIAEGGPLRREAVRYHHAPESYDAPADRPWVRLEPGLGLEYGPGIANPDLGVVDPEWYLALLASAAKYTARSAVTDEQEEIDGVTTDVYRLSCQLTSPECAYPDEDDPLLRMFPDYHQINVRFWLDDAGRPRRLEAESRLQVTSTSTTLGQVTSVYTAEATMTFRGYGEPVDVSPPPRDQISEWPPAA